MSLQYFTHNYTCRKQYSVDNKEVDISYNRESSELLILLYKNICRHEINEANKRIDYF